MAYNSTTWTTSGQSTTLANPGTTMYAYFNIGQGDSANFLAGYHYPIQFSGHYTGGQPLEDDLNFGNGSDPATSFTTADGSATDASLLINKMWYVPDGIIIDEITSIEGANNANGDTTRMHLYSYDFTSGSTSCLTNGALLAYTSDEGLTNDGSEQAYLQTWTISNSSVSSGKIVLAFWEQDSTNSDYSVVITVKYRVT